MFLLSYQYNLLMRTNPREASYQHPLRIMLQFTDANVLLGTPQAKEHQKNVGRTYSPLHHLITVRPWHHSFATRSSWGSSYSDTEPTPTSTRSRHRFLHTLRATPSTVTNLDFIQFPSWCGANPNVQDSQDRHVYRHVRPRKKAFPLEWSSYHEY
jgi:hypothetical protein